MSDREIKPLTEEYIPLLSDFYAEVKDGYDYFRDYLVNNGLLDNKQGIAKSYVYIETIGDCKKILGFYAVRSSSLIFDIIDGGKKIGEPALEIYELAVHNDYQRQNIGYEMMQNIFAMAYNLNRGFLGVKHLVVCAKETAVDFYKKFEMKEIPGYQSIPRTSDNKGCVGMSVRLKFKD